MRNVCCLISQRGTEYWNKFKEPERLWEKELMQQTVAGVPSVQLGSTHSGDVSMFVIKLYCYYYVV